MFPDFNFPGQDNFERSQVLPQYYRGPVLRGSAVDTAYHPNVGTMVLQCLETDDFSIRLNHFDFIKPVTLYCYQQAARLVSFLSIKNAVRLAFHKPGHMDLRQGQFMLLHSAEEHTTSARFEQASEYQMLEIGWSDSILSEHAVDYPIIDPVFSSIQSFFITAQARHASAVLMNKAHEIIRSPYSEADSQNLLYHQVQEYLICLLIETAGAFPEATRLTLDEQKRVKALAEKIRSLIHLKFPLAETAREIGMNKTKLQHAFQQIHGVSFYQYQLNERMNEARRLLEESDLSIKEISTIAGYKHSTHFIKKFREHFGFNPSIIRDRR